MDTHKFAVRELAKEIRSFYDQKRPFRVYHGSTHSSHAARNPRAVVHTAGLHHILDINKNSKFAIVEPNVPMDKLVKGTLKYGLIPPVVPAFPGTTVGGTFAGTAGGSSSFKYGFFDRAVLWLEIILANGKVTRASRTRNEELLSGMVGTLGTVGIATLFQIKLVPAKKWVELTYLPVDSTIEALDTINRFSQDPENDFVEGLVYGPKTPTYGVIAIGKFKDTKEYPRCGFSGTKDDWFYQHVLEAGHRTESVPIMDYLFRYDRGSFCVGRYCFGTILYNKWTRMLTDSATHSRCLAQTMQALSWADHFIVQDLVIPLESTFDILNFLEENVEIYPLRLCPIRQWLEHNAIMRPNPRKTNLFMGIGIRGYTPDTLHNPNKFKEKHREIEQEVYRLGGIKWLYSRNDYTEEEFWDIYPRRKYEELRRKYDAEYLQSVFQKIETKETTLRPPPLRGFWDRVFARTSVLAMKHVTKDT